MSFNPIKLGLGIKLLADGTVAVDAATLPTPTIPPATATDAGLVKFPAGSGVIVDTSGAGRIDGKVPAASTGTPALNVGLIDGATGNTWTIQQQFTAALADSSIISKIAAALANTFAPIGSGSSSGTTTPAETIMVNTPAAQTVGVAFTVTGTYSNATPASLEYSKDGEQTWAASGATIGSGSYSFPLTLNTAGTGRTLSVRDAGHASVKAASGAFNVAAASGGTPASAYTFTKRTQDMTTLSVPNDGSYVTGGNITFYAVKTADGTAASSVMATYSTSQTVAPPSGNFGNLTPQNLNEAGAPSGVVWTYNPFFNAPGTYYYWVQGPDGVAVQMSGFAPMVVGAASSGSTGSGGSSASTTSTGPATSVGTPSSSAYTVTTFQQGPSTGATYNGGYAPTLNVVKKSDGSTPATKSVRIGGSTSQTVPPPSDGGTNDGAFQDADLVNGTAHFQAYPAFANPGTYHWWVQGPDGVQFPVPDANPITIS